MSVGGEGKEYIKKGQLLFILPYTTPTPTPTGDNGTVYFWDWRSGYNFQKFQTQVQPGSIDSEAGIFDLQFDISGSRLITAEADKTIKIYKEDETAVSVGDLPFLVDVILFKL